MPNAQGGTDDKVKELSTNLDSIENYVDRWGVVGISEVEFIPASDDFKIAYKDPRTLEQYVDAARKQLGGGAAQSLQQIFDFRSTGSVHNEGATPANSVKVSDKSKVQDDLSAEKLSAPLSLLGSGDYSISERQALQIGFNDAMTEKLLTYLSSPKKGFVGKKKHVFFAIPQVTCHPKWRTSREYIGEIYVALEYAKKSNPTSLIEPKSDLKDLGKAYIQNIPIKDSGALKFSSMEPGNNPRPSVLAVLPLLDAQTLALKNSNRNQIGVMTYLSAALAAQGADAQAEVLAEYVRRYESDQISRTPLPLVSSYTEGNGFGFQFYPAFQALGKPAEEESGADMILQPISFPALVAILVDEDECKGWDYIAVQVSSHWSPQASEKLYKRAFVEKNRNSTRLDIARRFDEATNTLEKIGSKEYPTVYSEAHRQILALQAQGLGQSSLTPIKFEEPAPPGPEPKALTIESVEPKVGWINSPTIFTVKGAGFGSAKTPSIVSATIGGQHCDFSVLGDTLMTVSLSNWNAEKSDAGGDLVLATARESYVCTNPSPITFTIAKIKDEKSSPEIAISRGPDGKVTNLKLQAGSTDDASKLLKAAEPPADDSDNSKASP